MAQFRVRAGVTVVTALLTVACGAGSTKSAHAPAVVPATPASSTPIAAASATPSTGQAAVGLVVLKQVGLKSSDLSPGYSGNVMQQGDVVVGQVTLDMCGGSFASEALRTARHQVAFQGKPNAISNEVVAYSGSGAAKALAEVRHMAAHCPKGLVKSTVGDIPPTLQRVTILPPSKSLPASSIRMSVLLTDPQTGQHTVSQLVYFVRGPVLSGVYVDAGGAAAQALAVRMAHIVATRLERAVPAS